MPVSPDSLTPRSQQVWSAQLERADRAEIARRTGHTRNMLARYLTCSSPVGNSDARTIAEAAGLRVVERGRDAFTMEVGS